MKIFAEKIDIYYNKEQVCSHVRNYGSHSWTLDINHYLTTLFRKPGALKGSLAFSQVDEKVKTLYGEYFIDDNKGFIELLKYCKDKNISFETIEKAVEKLKQISLLDINKDKILMVIDNLKSPETKQDTDSETYKLSQIMLNELATAFN